MKTQRRRLFVVLLLPLLLLAAAYWLADSWLESAGGRRVLENALGSRSGVPVRLSGEFNLMLLPAIGVSGTGLLVGGAGPDSELARSQEYEISVALMPLFSRRVLLESVRLTGGIVYPGRYSIPEKDDSTPARENSRLPEIQELILRDFRIVMPGEDGAELHIKELVVREFAESRATPFSLDIGNLGQIEGQLVWKSGQSALELNIEWVHENLGKLILGVVMFLDNNSGDLDATYTSEALENAVSIVTQYEYLPAGLRLSGIRLESAGQAAGGAGCLLGLDETPRLQLDLASDIVDLDVFQNVSLETGSSDMNLPLDLDISFTARELKTAGAVIRGAALRLGGEPDCSGLDPD